MIRCFIFMVCIVFAFESGVAFAHDNNTGILYGPDNWYSITAPKGWLLDNQSGVNQGLHAVFYPKGDSWKDSPTVMYTKAVVKEEGQSFDDFVAFDTDYFKKNEPTLTQQTIAMDQLLPGKRLHAQRMNYQMNREIIVYIDEPKTVTEIVMTARSDTAYDQSIPAFKELVKSYKFFGTKVEIN